MDLIITNAAFINKAAQNYKQLRLAGFSDFLLDYNAFKTEEVMDEEEGLKYVTEAFINQTKKDGINVSIAKSIIFSEAEIKTRPAEALKRIFEETLKAASSTGVRKIIIEPFAWDRKQPLDREEMKVFYLYAASFLSGTNIQILIKNQYQPYNGSLNRGFLSDVNQFKDFVDELNHKAGEARFAVAIDTGVANVCGQNIPELIRGLGNLIGLIILNENNGKQEGMGLPFSSTVNGVCPIDWADVIRALRQIDFDEDIMIDFSEIYWNTPSPLKQALVEYAKKTADYFMWQISLEGTIRKYDKRVLFGAGNMCKEYMDHYGGKYPPLFTCDNNKGLWGQQTCGLEIKNPQELKNLDSDTAIFICNTYYNEIEKQLREMDLPNPIERFNDEILPPINP